MFGLWMPTINRPSVDFPAPLGPIRPSIWSAGQVERNLASEASGRHCRVRRFFEIQVTDGTGRLVACFVERNGADSLFGAHRAARPKSPFPGADRRFDRRQGARQRAGRDDRAGQDLMLYGNR